MGVVGDWISDQLNTDDDEAEARAREQDARAQSELDMLGGAIPGQRRRYGTGGAPSSQPGNSYAGYVPPTFDENGNVIDAGTSPPLDFGVDYGSMTELGGGGVEPYTMPSPNTAYDVDPTHLSFGPGGDVNPYTAGEAIDPELMKYADRGPSSWAGIGSAYTGLGPSAYETMGPSAYGDLAFDESSLAGMQGSEDYFSDLMTTGTDAVAEADYARRQREAEQSRRSQADAALAAAEARGEGGYGNAFLAELSADQGMAGDLYSAGMDANAVAQARRDAAATSRADIAERRGKNVFDADEARASGLDKYGFETSSGKDKYATDVAGGKDEFAGKRAAGMDDWEGDAWDDWYDVQSQNVGAKNVAKTDWANRTRDVSDRNTDLHNDTNYFNEVEAPESLYEKQKELAFAKAGNFSDQADTSRDQQTALEERRDRQEAATKQTVANIATWGGSSGGKDDDEEDKK